MFWFSNIFSEDFDPYISQPSAVSVDREKRAKKNSKDKKLLNKTEQTEKYGVFI